MIEPTNRSHPILCHHLSAGMCHEFHTTTDFYHESHLKSSWIQTIRGNAQTFTNVYSKFSSGPTFENSYAILPRISFERQFVVMCGLLRMSIRFSARTFMNIYHEFEKKFVVMRRLLRMSIRFSVWTLIERNPPPWGGFLFSMFPHQEPRVRGPPSKHQVLRGGPSYSRFLMREHCKYECVSRILFERQFVVMRGL